MGMGLTMIISVKYKEKVSCHSVQCLCGETYTRHKIDYLKACENCDTYLVDENYRVITSDEEGSMLHSIAICPACGGFDLSYWTMSKSIDNWFSSGHKVFRK